MCSLGCSAHCVVIRETSDSIVNVPPFYCPLYCALLIVLFIVLKFLGHYKNRSAAT